MCEAEAAERAVGAVRSPVRQADGRAEVHEGLIEGAGILSAWIMWGERILDGTADGQQCDILTALQDAHGDAQYVAVDGRQRQAEGNRADGAGGIAPDARQRQERCKVGRHLSAEVFNNLAGSLLEIARAVVVAEPLPEFHEELVVAAREARDVGQRFEEARVVRDDGRGARLLQHDLGDPGVVRRDLFAPWQAAQRGLAAIPGQQRLDNLGQDIGVRQLERRVLFSHCGICPFWWANSWCISL